MNRTKYALATCGLFTSGAALQYVAFAHMHGFAFGAVYALGLALCCVAGATLHYATR